MKISAHSLACALFGFVAPCVFFLSAARADDEVSTIKFSDPAQPGILKIRLAHGDLRVTGVAGTTGEITIKADAKAATATTRKDGLRVLTTSSSYSLSEKANVVSLDATENWTRGGGGDFNITVPRSTSIIVSSAWGGDVTCLDLSGDVEIKGLNGEVKLTNLTGGALVETMNGEITASILELHEGKPLSFTSMNGEVALHLPANAKANIRLRTQNGSILTDFDEQALVTKTETAASPPSKSKRSATIRKTTSEHTVLDSATHEEIRDAVREVVRAGAEIAREASSAIREAAQAAREGAEEVREASSEFNSRSSANGPSTPLPPLPPLPPMTGGKIVSGTLNGGGPDIRIATMNGDVTLRKLAPKK